MDQDLRVSIIVPTYNRQSDLKRCLDSLMKQTVQASEIIVIDHGSTDGTLELLKEYPTRVIRNSTLNLSHKFNLGWRNASCDIVAYFNDDSELEPCWLEIIINTFKKFRNAGAVGGPTIGKHMQQIPALYEKLQHTKLGLLSKIYETVVLENRLFDVGVFWESGAYSVGGGLPRSAQLKHPFLVDFLSFTGVAIKRSVIQEVGGLDENFFWGHMDLDLFTRIKNAGYDLVFDPRAIVWHHVNPSGDTRNPFNLGRDQAVLYMKHVHPKSLGVWLRFLLNVIGFNAFWVYKFFSSKDEKYLNGIRGFVQSFNLKTWRLNGQENRKQ